ncbi:hypothetical protein [Streptomyces aidingensis]|uniref:Uncharacterized protein n=1 Tax=Streptomyces aidingensis TaxID=910347 RepID=A0A1I1H259_9ACTN|nr:hypothetical protein [Streptomyces aidingensis]SFC18127.1 hypothetical protein SAMN05421773_102226 [Streptomyces aidingensis]
MQQPPAALTLAATFALGDLPRLLGTAAAHTLSATHHHILAALHTPSAVLAGPATTHGALLLRGADLQRFGPVDDGLLAGLHTRYPPAVRTFRALTRLPLIVGFLPSARPDPRLEQWEDDLATALTGLPGVTLIHPADWTRRHPVPRWFDDRTDELAHLPFTPEYQTAIARTLTETARTTGCPARQQPGRERQPPAATLSGGSAAGSPPSHHDPPHRPPPS